MNVLLTGGAGYIGSHIVRALQAAGHECVVFDNLARGHREAIGETPFVHGDVTALPTLVGALREHAVDAVIHLAAWIEAGESVEKPDKYFMNNTLAGLTLLTALREAGVSRLVFSSTAAVYGTPETVPIVETARLQPINPYGASKLCVEYMLQGYCPAFGLGSISLRYFNVAGAAPAGDIGEAHAPETHLIPLVLQVALGRRESIKIFGEDYDTPDGTCVRDYIHVCDLAEAHVQALENIQPGRTQAFNLGNGEGFSVREVVETCRAVTGKPIPAEAAPRRRGDPSKLVASSAKAQAELGWVPKYPQLRTIVEHAWAWHRGHPDGYEA